MSRIAKDPVIIPEGVTINIVDNLLEFKGSKGELSLHVHNSISFEMKDFFKEIVFQLEFSFDTFERILSISQGFPKKSHTNIYFLQVVM